MRTAMPGASKSGLLAGVGLLAGGVAAGVVLASAWGANATTAGSGTANFPNTSNSSPLAWPDRSGAQVDGLSLSGTVTAVGTSSVTIKTANGTVSYAVTANSDIDKNGEAKLSDLKVGDAVRFSITTTSGKPAIDKLHAGNEQLDRPSRPSGDPVGGLAMSGTVTAVGSSSVTIRTASGTATYAVTANSDIDKNGEAKLSDLKIGDAVRFSTTTASGKPAIDKLHAGNEQLNHPTGPRAHLR
jgi:Cu/Ag efflux protein CusF